MVTEWDFSILEHIRNNLSCGFMDILMTFFTYLGEKGIFWLALGIALLFFKRTRVCGIALLCSVAATFLIGELCMKNIICRERPFIQNEDIKLIISPPSGYSFPSGHTGSSFSAATAIFLTTRRSSIFYGIAAYLTAALIAFSRLYHSVHFPTDVIAGMALGIICATIITILIMKKLQSKQI